MNPRSIVFLFILIIAVYLLYTGRGFIYMYFDYLHTVSGEYYFIYFPQIVSWIFNVFVFIVLFDIYYVLFKSNLISSLKKWIIGLITNYLLLIIVFLVIIYSYYLILVNYVMKSIYGFETKLNSLNLIYMLIVFFTGLIHICLSSIRYLVIFIEKTCYKKAIFSLNKLINILWENKGSFILWIFMGYFIVGAVGMTGELIGIMLSQIGSLASTVSFPLMISINTAVMYIFYRYFIENYILDILLFIRSRHYFSSFETTHQISS